MISLILAAAIAGATPASAAPAPGQPVTQPAARPQASDPNKLICEKQEALGSRLARRKVCKTREQWAQDRLDDRQLIEKVQVQRGMKAD